MRALLACVLSILLPGLGQIYNKQYKKGLIFAGCVQGFGLISGQMRFVYHFRGLIVFLVIVLAANIAIVVDAAIVARRQQPSPHKPSAKHSIPRFALFAVAATYIFVFNQYALRSLALKAYIVPVNSMAPTIESGDHIYVETKAYARKPPSKGDVIIIDAAANGSYHKGLLVKRVIATGGDVIEGKDNQIYLNRIPLQEPYLAHQKPDSVKYEPNYLVQFGAIKIPKGMFFVMGDNRPDSWDSRSKNFGLVSRNAIKAKVLYVYWSKTLSRVGKDVR